jgi:hypothetical protein
MCRKASPSLVVVVLALASSAGCGEGDGMAGLSGRQIVRGHDVADLFFANPTTLAFTRQASVPDDDRPQDFWVWGLSDAEPAIGLEGIDWAPPTWWPRQLIGDLLQTGSYARLFYDFTARRATDLSAFGAIPPEAGVPVDGGGVVYPTANNYQRVTLVRRDAGAIAITGLERGTLGVGRPDELQRFNLDGYITSLAFMGSDLALLYVTPSPTFETPAVGIYKLAIPSGELTPLVEALPISEWDQTLESCAPYDTACGLFRVVGCGASDPPCPGSGKPPCYILYARRSTSDPNVTSAFAYDVSAKSSFWVPGKNPLSFMVSPDQHTIVWESHEDPQNAFGVIRPRFWDLCSNVEALCPTGGVSNVISFRPGGNGFALFDLDGPMRVGNGETCAVAGESAVYQGQYSPTGDRLMWLGDDGSGNGTEDMWLGAGDGTSPVQLAAGGISGGRFSSDGQRIIYARRSTDTSSLWWLDLTASPPEEHRLADNYGGFSRGGVRRILLVDHWNSQDASGDLVLVDVDSGARHDLGRAVTDLAVSGDVDTADANVAYTVRSRAPANRDGLWLTTLPP